MRAYGELQCLAFPHWLHFTATDLPLGFHMWLSCRFLIADFFYIYFLIFCHTAEVKAANSVFAEITFTPKRYFEVGLWAGSSLEEKRSTFTRTCMLMTLMTVFFKKMQWIMAKFPEKNWDLISQYSSISHRMIVSCSEIPLANMHSGLISVAAHP